YIIMMFFFFFFFFSSRRRHTRFSRDWSSDVCSSDLFSLKSIFARNSGLSMLVFDEIDIGISGKTAAKVANKMKDLSKDLQTLVRSEERRVGKECRSRWWTYHKEKKEIVHKVRIDKIK